jgi:hypothetical protein
MERIEVNMIRCTGPAFVGVDQRLLALELVSRRLTEATMFRSDGEVVDAGELLYRKPLLIVRGHFRPVTKTVVELVRAARTRFLEESDVAPDDLVVMAEMTLRSLSVGEEVHHEDFLDRVDILGELGMHVLITNTFRNFRLVSYLFQHTKQRSAAVMGLPILHEMFRDEYYSDLEGGILEAFGRLFKNDLRLYVYPTVDETTGDVVTVETMDVPKNLRHLLAYLIENRFIEGLDAVDRKLLSVFPRDVLGMIQSGIAGWEDLVPERVAELIKSRKLLQYQEPS